MAIIYQLLDRKKLQKVKYRTMEQRPNKGCRWFGLQKKAGHATKLCPDMSTCDEINCTNPELQPYTDHSDLGARNTDDHIQEKLIQKWKEGKLDENSPLYKLISNQV